MRPKIITTAAGAEQAVELCKSGFGTVVKTFIDGHPEYQVLAKSGAIQAISRRRAFHHLFEDFMDAHGVDDGLLIALKRLETAILKSSKEF